METTRERTGVRSLTPFARLPVPSPGTLRFLRFGLVGSSGVAINLAALWLFHDELGLALGPAGVLAVALATVNNFVWNNYWTFGATGFAARRLAQFVAVSLVGMVINVTALKLLVHFGAHYLPADFAGILVATSWNFLANSRWTWGGTV